MSALDSTERTVLKSIIKIEEIREELSFRLFPNTGQKEEIVDILLSDNERVVADGIKVNLIAAGKKRNEDAQKIIELQNTIATMSLTQNNQPANENVLELTATHCDFTCYTKQQLGVQQTKHDKRFVCDKCHKRFAQKSQLDVHVNAVHYNQRPFSCVLCNKSFKTKGSHDAHMIVHTDNRNYQCPHCDKKCRKRNDLTLHIRTHTGEKPFKCSVCGRRFVQMCDTHKHEMLHFKPGKRKNMFFSSPETGMADDE